MAMPIPGRDPEGSPAIWIYPEKPQDFSVKLFFAGDGFLTASRPDYNDAWRIHADPSAPFYRYTNRFGGDPFSYPFLDYDGFRSGPFQKDVGWCVEQERLLDWQRTQLKEIGFTSSEIDDVNYTYGRMLLERRYKDPLFAIYPQEASIVDKSVALEVSPRPDSVFRLWLYFVPVKEPPPRLKAPQVARISRKGLTVVELAYLTDREIPGEGRRLLGARSGHEVHPQL